MVDIRAQTGGRELSPAIGRRHVPRRLIEARSGAVEFAESRSDRKRIWRKRSIETPSGQARRSGFGLRDIPTILSRAHSRVILVGVISHQGRLYEGTPSPNLTYGAWTIRSTGEMAALSAQPYARSAGGYCALRR